VPLLGARQVSRHQRFSDAQVFALEQSSQSHRLPGDGPNELSFRGFVPLRQWYHIYCAIALPITIAPYDFVMKTPDVVGDDRSMTLLFAMSVTIELTVPRV